MTPDTRPIEEQVADRIRLAIACRAAMPGDADHFARSLAHHILALLPRWQPLDTAPIPPPEGLPSYWEFRCLIQSESGVVCEGYASYVGNYRKQKGNDKPPILRWYRSRNGRVERNAKYWMPLPAPLTDGLKGGD